MQKKRRRGRTSTKTSVEHKIAHLRGLDLGGLRARWQLIHFSLQRPPVGLPLKARPPGTEFLDAETRRLPSTLPSENLRSYFGQEELGRRRLKPDRGNGIFRC